MTDNRSLAHTDGVQVQSWTGAGARPSQRQVLLPERSWGQAGKGQVYLEAGG